LNHVAARNEIVRTYDRYDYAPEIIEALAKWEAHLLGIIGKEGPSPIPIVRRSWEWRGECGRVLTVLKDGGTSMNLADLAAAADVPRASAGAYLAKMVNAGKVIRTERGRFLYPDNQLVEDPQQKAEIR
jgi:hypothetical protein